MRHNLGYGIMPQLVEARPVIVDLLEKRRLRRDADEVTGHVVVGTLAADAEVGARRGDQRLGARDDLPFR